MRLKPTKGTIGILSGVLGLSILSIGGVIWLQQNALAQTMTSLTQREAEVRDGQKIARRREEAREALEADQSQIQFLETGVNDAAYVPTLLKQLEGLAGQTKNRVIGVRPILEAEAGPSRLQQRRDPDAQGGGDGENAEEAPKEKPDPYTRLTIQVNLVGRFQTTQAFIDQLMRFPKIVSVNEIQIRPHRADGADDKQSGLLDVELKLTAFVMKPVGAGESVSADASAGEPR